MRTEKKHRPRPSAVRLYPSLRGVFSAPRRTHPGTEKKKLGTGKKAPAPGAEFRARPRRAGVRRLACRCGPSGATPLEDLAGQGRPGPPLPQILARGRRGVRNRPGATVLRGSAARHPSSHLTCRNKLRVHAATLEAHGPKQNLWRPPFAHDCQKIGATSRPRIHAKNVHLSLFLSLSVSFSLFL